ncbi:MAG: glycogen synthase [Desulfobacterales bacterium]
MNILLLTNEYPPHIYGGAGVHVEHLVRELGRLDNGHNHLQVLCFGDQQENSTSKTVKGIGSAQTLSVMGLRHPKLLDTLYRNIVMAGSVQTADIVHCHTWYTYLAGSLIKQLLQIPLVLTTHSLEPSRPWKKEQLGNGYYAAGWLEKTALNDADRVIAVSQAMRADILNLYGVAANKVPVIHNGIDADTYRPTRNPGIIEACGIDADTPYVLFVGRVTRQKGITHLLEAMRQVEARVQLVLCAGAADTPQIEEEVTAAVAAVRAGTAHQVIWLREMVPAERLIALYSHAAVFVCPSVYEPFGIINLEAMACGTPVIAAAVGGIPEVVVQGETGLLVPLEPAGPDDAEPQDPQKFAHDLAEAIDSLLCAPLKRASMGAAARRRVEAHFSWKSIARRTLETYAEVAGRPDESTPN